MGGDGLLAVGAGLVGLCFGSFLNVCILRLPHDQSLLRPPSTCPKCRKRIAWRDNIPVASWLLLRGRCRHCHAPISKQYPLIEALVGVWWAVAVLVYGFTLHALAGAAGAGRGERVGDQEDTHGEARADQQGAGIEPASVSTGGGHGDSMADGARAVLSRPHGGGAGGHSALTRRSDCHRRRSTER